MSAQLTAVDGTATVLHTAGASDPRGLNLMLDGPESPLPQIVRVRYRAQDQYARAVVRRFAEQQRGCACRLGNERLSLRAKVELRSGQAIELEFASPAAE